MGLGALGMNAANAAVGGIMGIAFGKQQDKRQINQQQKLQDMQIKGQQQMVDYNYGKQMQMWKDTNYGAQVDQLKEAGLNPGLMYGMGGGGGTTAGQATGSVQGGNAPSGGGEPMGMGIAMMQAQLMKAQKENIEADTENKKAETPNIGKTGGNIEADTANKQANTILTNSKNKMAEIENQYLYSSLSDRIQKTAADAVIAVQQGQQEIQNTDISQQTKDDVIKQIKAEAIGAVLKNSLTRAQTRGTDASTTKTGADTKLSTQAWEQNIQKLAMDWINTGISERELARKLREEGGEDLTDELSRVIGGAIQAIIFGKAVTGAKPHTPVQGFKR